MDGWSVPWGRVGRMDLAAWSVDGCSMSAVHGVVHVFSSCSSCCSEAGLYHDVFPCRFKYIQVYTVSG